MQPTQEQIDFYYTRTNIHIHLVRKYIKKIYDVWKFPALQERQQIHDQTKYYIPELVPYIFTTWMYHCQKNNILFEISEDLKKRMHEATYHHVKNNRHHPEFHDKTTTSESINSVNRDKPPERIVSGENMTNTDIAEMVADWCAVSEERKNTPQDWAKANINIRWKFTPVQEDLIYNIMLIVWD